ncbi:hypothetical protein KHA94_02175 [Bacillus sp. FJAT-49705]|uniref:Uncharacterized protein n=1 Tax=Cytobacillus citreus TaxID=2833586 RepID=A0ABS5NMJ4_9BACI|nr:hypothetical protein [Cytobacillus citreus]
MSSTSILKARSQIAKLNKTDIVKLANAALQLKSTEDVVQSIKNAKNFKVIVILF